MWLIQYAILLLIYRSDYYDVTDISGHIKDIEKTSGGINVIVSVDFYTKIRAETPDDAPYIKRYFSCN